MTISDKINLPGYGQSLTRGKIEKASGKVADDVKSTTETILKQKTLVEILKKHNFIRRTEEGLIVADFTNYTFAKRSSGNEGLASFFRELFHSNYYIKGFFKNIQILNDIYDNRIKKTDKFVLGEEFMQVDILPDIKVVDNNAKEITVIDMENTNSDEELDTYDLYYKPGFSDKNRQAIYPFPHGVDYNSDKFIANLYKHGLRYGIDTTSILSGIAHSSSGIRTNKNLVIAKQKDAEDGTDAYIKIISSKVQEDLRSRDVVNMGVDTHSSVNLYAYANATFDVKEGELLLEKVSATPGKIGRDVTGKKIDPNAGEDIVKLEDIIGEGLGIKIIEEIVNGKNEIHTVVVATRSGTLQKDAHTEKYIVTDGYIVQQVDVKTGDISINGENKLAIVEGDVVEGRSIKGDFERLEINGNVYGTIEVSGNTEVIIKGNMSGKSRLFHKGTGKIEVRGMVSNLSDLDAKDADVKISKLQNGNVYVNSIELGEFFNGNIIAKKVSIGELNVAERARVAIVTEQIDIGNLNSIGTFRLTLMSRQLSVGIEGLLESKKNSKWAEFTNTLNQKAKFIKCELFDINNLEGIRGSLKLQSDEYKIKLSKKLDIFSLPESALKAPHKQIIDGSVSSQHIRLPYSVKLEMLKKQTKTMFLQLEEIYKTLLSLLNDIDNLNKEILKAKDPSNNSYLNIHSHIPNAYMELYNYYYTSFSDDFSTITKQEFDSIIKGTKLFERTHVRLAHPPFKYIPHKKD